MPIEGDASPDALSRLSINGYFFDLCSSLQICNLPRVIYSIKVDQERTPNHCFIFPTWIVRCMRLLGRAKESTSVLRVVYGRSNVVALSSGTVASRKQDKNLKQQLLIIMVVMTASATLSCVVGTNVRTYERGTCRDSCNR